MQRQPEEQRREGVEPGVATLGCTHDQVDDREREAGEEAVRPELDRHRLQAGGRQKEQRSGGAPPGVSQQAPQREEREERAGDVEEDRVPAEEDPRVSEVPKPLRRILVRSRVRVRELVDEIAALDGHRHHVL